jgi:hypothetical protein
VMVPIPVAFLVECDEKEIGLVKPLKHRLAPYLLRHGITE